MTAKTPTVKLLYYLTEKCRIKSTIEDIKGKVGEEIYGTLSNNVTYKGICTARLNGIFKNRFEFSIQFSDGKKVRLYFSQSGLKRYSFVKVIEEYYKDL